VALSIFDERTVILEAQDFAVGDSPSQRILVVAKEYGARVDSLVIRNSDSIDHLVDIAYQIGGDNFVFMQITAPAGAGCGTVVLADALGNFWSGAIGGILLGPANELHVGVDAVPLVSGDIIISALGGQF
jgi:hypothetical protein